MCIKEVESKQDKRAFLDLVKTIYQGDTNYIRPLDVQIEEIFDPSRNVFFRHGEATRFLLLDDNGKTIGRIGAFINREKAYGFEQPTGGAGFFECVNDQQAANQLLDAVKQWLVERGMQAMDAPINFGENENFWGLLVEGFLPPGIGMPYNPPYYKQLFENYGFAPYFTQETRHLDLRKPFPERFWRIAERIAAKPEFRFEHLRLDNALKYMNDLQEVYRAAWEFHENFKPIDQDDLQRKLDDVKDFIEEDFIWFAYASEEPIAFLVMYPDLNQIIRRLNGKMNFWAKLKFVYLRWRKTITRSRIVIMGVKPQYQRMGIESALFCKMAKMMKRHPEYTEAELSWVGDFNPKMQPIHAAVGSDFAKRHITYRYLFDDNKQEQHSTVIATDTKEKWRKD